MFVAGQPGERRAQVRFRSVPEFDDERVTTQDLLHDAALDTDSPAVDQANQPQPRGVRRNHVLVDHGRDIARLEGVQVDRILDGNVLLYFFAASAARSMLRMLRIA